MNIKEQVSLRISRLQVFMQQEEVDVAILLKPETVFYFSNFNPVINSHPCLVVIPAEGEATLLVHALRCDHAKEEGVVDNVQIYGSWGARKALAANPVDAIGMLLRGKTIRLGLELDVVNMLLYSQLQTALSPKEIVDITACVRKMKIIKDEYEITNIRIAAALVDCGVETTIKCLAKGYSEAEACTEGQYHMRQMWHNQFPNVEVSGFGTSEGGMVDSLCVWSLSNEHITYGCDCPKHYHPRSGDIVLPMAWAKVNGYHAENERTVIIGKITGTRVRAYEAMLAARKAIFDVLRPGTSFESLFLQAAEVYKDYGFGNILPGRVGHSIGNSAHEPPSLEKGAAISLEPGMVFTVEPGIMDKSWGGVRHSDTVLITSDGYERLTKLRDGAIVISPANMFFL